MEMPSRPDAPARASRPALARSHLREPLAPGHEEVV